MKKYIALLLVLLMVPLAITGCQSGGSSSESPTSGSDADTSSGGTAAAMEGAITVISREDGSGTRGAFVELVGVLDEEDNDITVATAEISNGTSVVMTSIAGNKSSIGYISLGSLNDSVKSIQIDGVDATVENIQSGDYKVARPFNIATKGAPTAEAQDFIDFIMSTEGQDVVEAEGFIRVDDNGAFEGGKVEGKIVIAGSTSVGPVMEKLAEAYEVINPNLDIEIQQTGSSAGMTSAIDGVCDIGMASRELKDSELEELTPIVMAQDGIAVVVNNENGVSNITMDQLKGIYVGEITDWSEIK